MAKRSADEAGIDVSSNVDVFKPNVDGTCRISRRNFVEIHAFLFVFTFEGHGCMFLFDEIDKRNDVVNEFQLADNVPRGRMVSSEADIIDVFNKATYTELNEINQPDYIYNVAITNLGVKIKFRGDPDIFLDELSRIPRASLTVLQKHYLEQLTAKYNNDE